MVMKKIKREEDKSETNKAAELGDVDILSRRSLLNGAIYTAGVITAWGLPKILNGVTDLVTKENNLAQIADSKLVNQVEMQRYRVNLLGDLFGFYEERVHVKPGADHPDYQNTHPDNQYAAQHYVGALKQNGIDVQRSEGNTSSDFQGNIILFGDPVSNSLTANVMQYNPTTIGADGKARSFEYCNGILELPFKLVSNEQELVELGVTKKVAKNKNNTSILNLTNQKQIFVPEIIDQNYVSDYLLITKVPNFLEQQSFDAGRSIVIFSGTHGPGTRSAALLMRDSGALLSIQEQVKDYNAWQAVIKCTDLPPWNGRVAHRQQPGRFEGKPVCAPVSFDENLIAQQFNEYNETRKI